MFVMSCTFTMTAALCVVWWVPRRWGAGVGLDMRYREERAADGCHCSLDMTGVCDEASAWTQQIYMHIYHIYRVTTTTTTTNIKRTCKLYKNRRSFSLQVQEQKAKSSLRRLKPTFTSLYTEPCWVGWSPHWDVRQTFCSLRFHISRQEEAPCRNFNFRNLQEGFQENCKGLETLWVQILAGWKCPSSGKPKPVEASAARSWDD